MENGKLNNIEIKKVKKIAIAIVSVAFMVLVFTRSQNNSQNQDVQASKVSQTNDVGVQIAESSDAESSTNTEINPTTEALKKLGYDGFATLNITNQ